MTIFSSSIQHLKSTSASYVIYPAGGGREISPYTQAKHHYLDLDHFISRQQQRILRQNIRERRDFLKITLVIPTQDSETYISKTVQNIIKQIRQAQQIHFGWNIELIIAVNGTNQERTSSKIRLLQKHMAAEDVQLTVFIMEDISGKVKAMNATAAYSKQQGADVIGFIDDDVNLSDQAISKIVTFLIEHEDIFLISPHRRPSRKPLPSEGLFARLEYELRREERQPIGACLFLLVNTYAPIPDNIILDDEALKYYYALPDDHTDPFARMKLVPETEVLFQLVGNQFSFWLRRVRLRMGAEQLAAVFNQTKSLVRRVRLAKSKAFWKQPFFGALPTKDKYYMGVYFFYYRVMLSFVRTLVRFKIAVRRARGYYPYHTKWYGARKAVSSKDSHTEVFQHGMGKRQRS